MKRMMIDRQSKRIQVILKRAVSWKIVAVLLFIHFALFEKLFADFVSYNQVFLWQDFFGYFVFLLGDRFVLLFANGFGLVYVFHRVFTVQENAYIKTRMGSDRQADFLSEMLIGIIAVLFLIVQIVLLVAVGAVGGTLSWVSASDFLLMVKLCINILGYYIVLGNTVFVLQEICKKRIWVYLCSVAILLFNYGISNANGFSSIWLGRTSWIGNIMMKTVDYSCNILYWIGWNLFLFFLLKCIRRVFKDGILIRIPAKVQRAAVFVGGTGIIFLVFGVVSKDNLLFGGQSTVETLLRNYFVGFDRIGVHLFLYLSYQLPIWIFAYQYLTRNFAVYGIQYVLRVGGIKKWFFRLVSKVMVFVVFYYLIGAVVLWGLNPPHIIGLKMFILYENILLVTNLILQTILFVLIAFFIWMLEESGKNIGFTGVLMVHLISVTIGAKHKLFAKWCPWIQGIYWLNDSYQLFSVLYQMVWIVVVVVAMMHYLKWCQNDVLTRKMKRI